jgi:hypothetical protein
MKQSAEIAAPAAPRETLTGPRVGAAIAILLVLAFVLPYGAVTTLHKKRLRAADEGTRAIAERLKVILAGQSPDIPAGTEVFAGPGDRPVVNDARWSSATSIPLARVGVVAPPDPWGNAYLVNIAALRSGGTVWILSAGPDGIVQTPFLSRSGPVADDRATPLR